MLSPYDELKKHYFFAFDNSLPHHCPQGSVCGLLFLKGHCTHLTGQSLQLMGSTSQPAKTSYDVFRCSGGVDHLSNLSEFKLKALKSRGSNALQYKLELWRTVPERPETET